MVPKQDESMKSKKPQAMPNFSMSSIKMDGTAIDYTADMSYTH